MRQIPFLTGSLAGSLALVGAVGLLAGCTSTHTVVTNTTTTQTISTSATTTTHTSPSTGPIATGPVTSTQRPCPFLDETTAANDIGERLARVTVQTAAGGEVVGCRFYNVQGTALAQSEHLSGPNQPAIEVDISHYADATSARNAMIRTAEAGVHYVTDSINAAKPGIDFQTTFDPTDGVNADWAYTFASGTTVVVVKINQTDSQFDVKAVATSIAPHF